MYNEYFGFKESPFSIAPDPHYLYMTAQHREALAHLVYGLNSEGGCILLTGEVGTGKTTICRCLLEQVPEHANIALLLNPKVTAIELLETICDEFKIVYPDAENSIKTYIDLINAFLLEAYSRGEKNVLIIDEAQNLDSTVLEQLRLLTNLETNQRKLLQIVILGQPELLEILSRNEMRQLAQRITARFHLKPISNNELKAYITHRLAIAGQNIQLFPDTVIRKIYQISKGIPRLINIICDRALLGTYVQNKPSVDVATLNQAAKEIFGELKNQTHHHEKSKMTPRLIGIAVSLSLFTIAAILAYQITQQPSITISKQSIQELLAINENPAEIAMETTQEIADPDLIEPEQKTAAVPESIAASTGEIPESQDDQVLETAALPAADPDMIDKLIESTPENKAEAFAMLFSLWGEQYDVKKNGSACEHATKFDLSCLYRSGNLHSLRRLNRPAVIKLLNSSGEGIYATITRLDTETATINTGLTEITIDTATLDTHWLGDYTLLWKKPPFYQNAVSPGNNGPIVQWLDQQLVRIYGQNTTPTISSTYSEKLISQVKMFQQSKGLFPDGIAGPRTLIHINNEVGAPAPQLLSQKFTRES